MEVGEGKDSETSQQDGDGEEHERNAVEVVQVAGGADSGPTVSMAAVDGDGAAHKAVIRRRALAQLEESWTEDAGRERVQLEAGGDGNVGAASDDAGVVAREEAEKAALDLAAGPSGDGKDCLAVDSADEEERASGGSSCSGKSSLSVREAHAHEVHCGPGDGDDGALEDLEVQAGAGYGRSGDNGGAGGAGDVPRIDVEQLPSSVGSDGDGDRGGAGNLDAEGSDGSSTDDAGGETTPSLLKVAVRAVAAQCSSWEDLARLGLPPNILELVLGYLPEVAAGITPTAAKEMAIEPATYWQSAYEEHLAAQRQRAVVDVESFMEFRMYGASSSRNLTMLPPGLQIWYADLADGTTLGFDHCHRLLVSLLAFIRQVKVAKKVDVATLTSWWERYGPHRSRMAGAGGLHVKDQEEVKGGETVDADTSRRGAGSVAPRPGKAAGAAETTVSDRDAQPSPPSVPPRVQARDYPTRMERLKSSPKRPTLPTLSDRRLQSMQRAAAAKVTFSNLEGSFAVASLGPSAAVAPHTTVSVTRKLPPRVGGGYGVYVSPPSKIPAKYAKRRKLNLQGKLRSKGVGGSRKGSRRPTSDIQSTAAASIQHNVRGLLARQLVSKRRIAAVLEAGVLPVEPSVLQIFGCGGVANLFVECICNLRTLRLLDLRGCRSLNGQAVDVIVDSCPRLQFLDLSGCVQLGDREAKLLGGLHQLVSLQLCGWSKLTAEGLIAFASQLPETRVAPAVKPIALAHRASHGISHRMVHGQAALKCAALRALNLSDCSSLDDRAISEVGNALPGLLDLCLFGCLKVSDRALVGFFGSSSRLARVNTSGAYKITNDGIRFMLHQAPSLLLYSNPNDFKDFRAEVENRIELIS